MIDKQKLVGYLNNVKNQMVETYEYYLSLIKQRADEIKGIDDYEYGDYIESEAYHLAGQQRRWRDIDRLLSFIGKGWFDIK